MSQMSMRSTPHQKQNSKRDWKTCKLACGLILKTTKKKNVEKYTNRWMRLLSFKVNSLNSKAKILSTTKDFDSRAHI